MHESMCRSHRPTARILAYSRQSAARGAPQRAYSRPLALGNNIERGSRGGKRGRA